jgi:type IV pilus assembly protein PilW
MKPFNISNAPTRGLSLVELMVALVIGLLISLVISSLYIGVTASNRSRESSARMQESARVAFANLGRSMRHMGFRSVPSVNWTSSPGGNTNAFLSVTETAGSNDIITVRYYGSGTGAFDASGAVVAGTADNTMVDCLGGTHDFGVLIHNTYAIRIGANGRNALFCSTAAAPNVATASDWTEIAPDIAGLQAIYGYQHNVVCPATAAQPLTLPSDVNSYGTYSTVFSTAANSNRVCGVQSVRVALLVVSPNTDTPEANGVTHTLLGESYGSFTDNRIRRVFEMNFGVRNQTP